MADILFARIVTPLLQIGLLKNQNENKKRRKEGEMVCPECGNSPMDFLISTVEGYIYKCPKCFTFVRVPIDTLAKRKAKPERVTLSSSGQPLVWETAR